VSYFQAIVIGLIQGVTELFPVSSLGHSVLLPGWFGWHDLVTVQSQSESFYLSFLVALHVGTALALLVYFRDEWARLIKAFFATIPTRKAETADQRLSWMIVFATVPVGVVGLALEHKLRTVFAKPEAAALFLMANGVLLLGGELVRRRMLRVTSGSGARKLSSLSTGEAVGIGASQILALFAGISRSGVTMIGGLTRRLDHEESAHFAFLLATPVILAAGVYKLPDFFGSLGNGIRGQALVGAVVAGVAAYFSTKFLLRLFETRTLWPFGIYCLLFGAASAIRFA
jgi:undecaprenyl-diphosphatase